MKSFERMKKKEIPKMRYFLLLASLFAIVTITQAESWCDLFINGKGGGLQAKADECEKIQVDPMRADKFPPSNIPLLNGAYCMNNGTGICKAFAGRFEFYFNTFTDEFLYPAPKSKYVDENGYHSRVPVSYTIDGDILYADRALLWANEFAQQKRKLNLLSVSDFNWCSYTEANTWPYKSAIKDFKSKGRFHIYFHNRQSCIFDTKTGLRQHYNTRFLHNSSLRQDLDMNPLIFAMEDHLAKEVRLVKNKRQHWYEVEYEVIADPTPKSRFFLKMKDTEKLPSRINGTGGPILSRFAYRKKFNVCLNDFYQVRPEGSKNSKLVSYYCGYNEQELVDFTVDKVANNGVYAVSLHNIAYFGEVHVGSFFNTTQWLAFAGDRVVFSAFTTIPTEDPNKLRVILLYAKFQESGPKDPYDEYYPMPYLTDYIATYEGTASWTFNREENQKPLKYLNYVDDIAYLHKCKTVLIIYGPLYSELPADKFNLETKARVGSITSLGSWELVNAFFADYNSETLYLFHRTNWISAHKYTCGKGEELVTASKSGKYYTHSGNVRKIPLNNYLGTNDRGNNQMFSEEYLFKQVGAYKGNVDPEAPDPNLYKAEYDLPAGPSEAAKDSWIYYLIGIGILLIVAMLVLCLMTVRRWRKKRRDLDGISVRSSLRSTTPSGATVRSSIPTSGISNATVRSSIPPRSKVSRISNKNSATPSSSGSKKRSKSRSVSTLRSSNHGSKASRGSRATSRSRMSNKASARK